MNELNSYIDSHARSEYAILGTLAVDTQALIVALGGDVDAIEAQIEEEQML